MFSVLRRGIVTRLPAPDEEGATGFGGIPCPCLGLVDEAADRGRVPTGHL